MAARTVDPRLVADVARELRGAAGHPYSARQLWYAVCARMEAPQVTQGVAQIVTGAGMLSVGVVGGVLATVFVAALVPVGMVVLGMGVQRRRLERNRPTTRALAVSYDAFVREAVDPLRTRGAALEGLVDTDEAPLTAAADATTLIVCDRAETAALLAALAAQAGLPWEVVDEESLPRVAEPRRVHTLHDADTRGCELPLRLAAAGATQVVDLGLRPGHITGRRIQVIEGAPAVVPAALSGLLTAEEVVWLADGQRVELAVLSPADLVAGLGRVLEVPPLAPPGAAPPGVALGGTSPIPAAPAEAVGGAR